MNPRVARQVGLVLVWVALFFPACATRQGVLQTSTLSSPRLVSDTLYFGTQKPRGRVTPTEWKAFLKDVVTPRFPGGLTTWEAKGQWKDKDGTVLREKSEVLLLVHPEGNAEEKAVQEIIDLYKKQFKQESVLRIKGKDEIVF
jgi:hypothetical protein